MVAVSFTRFVGRTNTTRFLGSGSSRAKTTRYGTVVLNCIMKFFFKTRLIIDSKFFFLLTKADGFHYRQPWVLGVEEQIERLTKRLEEVEVVINWVLEVNNHIQRLEVTRF